MSQSRFWFGRKRFGFGFGPRTWEGWLTVLVYLALMTLVPRLLEGQVDPAVIKASWIGLTVAFFAVFLWKLERPSLKH